MDIRHLRHFCAIISEGQISRAAQKLHISQPTLSLTLKELETELGCSLIDRSGGRWSITEQGEFFYREAQRLLSRFEDLETRMKSPFVGRQMLYGEVRIGCSGFCTSFVRDIMPELCESYPGINLRLMIMDNFTLEISVKRQELDIALIQLPKRTDCHDLPLPVQRFIACWSPLLPRPPEQIDFEEIARHPLVVARRWANSGAYRPFIIAMQEQGLTPRIVLDTPFVSFFGDVLRSLPAVAIMPESEVSAHMRKEFAVRSVNMPQMVFRSAIIWRKTGLLSPQAAKIVELIARANSIQFSFEGGEA